MRFEIFWIPWTRVLYPVFCFSFASASGSLGAALFLRSFGSHSHARFNKLNHAFEVRLTPCGKVLRQPPLQPCVFPEILKCRLRRHHGMPKSKQSRSWKRRAVFFSRVKSTKCEREKNAGAAEEIPRVHERRTLHHPRSQSPADYGESSISLTLSMISSSVMPCKSASRSAV